MKFRAVYLAGLISAIVCLSTYQILLSNLGLLDTLRSLADMVANIVPSILIMSKRAVYPPIAEISWAIQWLFFPIYILTLFISNVPWSKTLEDELKKNRYGVRYGLGHTVVSYLAMAAIACMILSDVGVVNLFSFIRGCGLELDGEISRAPALIRAPFTSNFGMLIYAWFIPFGVAFVYWGFVCMLLNPKVITGYNKSPT